MFHPVLLAIAGGFALVAIRLILGRGWALGIATANFAFAATSLLGGNASPVHTRAVGVFITAALAVEMVAAAFGTEARVRFAVLSGLGVATIGLAGEWWWNQGAYQPWHTSLLPGAVILGAVAAVGAAVLATAFARAAGHQVHASSPRRWVLAAAGVAVLATIALPMPRHTGHVVADVKVGTVVDGYAPIDVTLAPPNAADHARWFQAAAWQGGGLKLADFRRVGGGHYVTEKPIPVFGGWKALVRLHRGGELMTVPLFLPVDAQIHKPEIPAVNRRMAFAPETTYLLRETHGGNALFKDVVYALLLGVMALWITAFSVAVARIAPRRPRDGEPADQRARDVEAVAA